ncbi:glyoxylase-like metal-dependent hydrolase (beta-lactamase superfamily II) [Roseibium hamelinense]|uniref:Glyoxylase-like metal-dependent hydrolase (Beta-lactamase superfamily II) n=1 Tax=Roseibium hamelinense TaxID=150831 RepID=A0A562SLW1_9HYPH|nr:MBL fold metallo-hydrolase [Roseibium hamelinense]MTI44931.1 MBL fold metallo-hydrolase [Roseibium hamelinense]TWI82192.1 glyoxylase-like metal-dependent hydrolase (beta-lactamase superfamily II) [Roseibium hamelinense]
MGELKIELTRRSALFGAAGAAAAAGLAATGVAHAAAEKQGALFQPVSRYGVGDMELTTLLDGAVPVGDPQKTFGMNVDADTFGEASENNFIPADNFKAFFTPTVINTGNELVLFDTGVGEGGRPARGNMRAALESAGYTPDQVDIVVLTHMHPDHIGGLMEGGAPAFPNARYVTGQAEFDFWSGMDPEANGVTQLMAKNVTPLADNMTFLGDGDSVVPGITAMQAFGHTPGHMTYMIESGGQQLLLAADLANHYVWSLGYPDWEVRFDMDKEAAALTRRRVLNMLASEKIPFVGYHMPFPAVGFVETDGDGFKYVAESYQLSL